MANAENSLQFKNDECAKYIANIVENLDEANKIIQTHEETNSLKFVTWIQTKDFGNSDIYQKAHKIWWEDDTILFSGIPFVMLGSKTLDCHYGKDRNLAAKKKRLSHDSEHPYKNPQSVRLTKKHGCPVKVHVKEIANFPAFKISGNTKWKREAGSKRLRTAIKEHSVAEFQRNFIVLIPPTESHVNHPPLEESITATAVRQKAKRKKPIQLGPSCRDLLDDIKTLTFMVEDEGAIMKDLHNNLDNIKRYLMCFVNEREAAIASSVGGLVEGTGSDNNAIILNSSEQQVITDSTTPFREQQQQQQKGVVIFKNNSAGKRRKKKIDDQQNDITTNINIITKDTPEQVQFLVEHPIDSFTPTTDVNGDKAAVMKVINMHHQDSMNSASVITKNNEKDSEECGVQEEEEEHDNLNPQEFEVLTNMIHVFLEESKPNH